MANVEDVLASMAEPNREEEELCFVIDKDFRLISVPERGTVLGVEGDKDVVSSKGTVRFTVYCVKKDADGTIEQAFGTTIGTGTSLEGLGGDEN